ncbi:MAG: phosphocholine cytidylyltransferase family protein [Candidatus Caenarcaniphilales bacterium]|nr:phosphocholine cytidylyltransferase family protein [Candidatus Caenarcaniphilales bacterium]
MKAIILAAGMSSRISSLTKGLPKTCLKINKIDSLLSRMLKQLAKAGFNEAKVVIGHAAEDMKNQLKDLQKNFSDLKINYIYNEDFNSKDNIYSVYLVKDYLADNTFIFNSDIVFEDRILDFAVNSAKNSDSSFLVIDDHKKLIDEDMKVTLNQSGFINRVSKSLENDTANGEYIGIMRIASKDKDTYAAKLSELIEANDVKRHYEYALDQVISSLRSPLKLKLVSTQGLEWTEIDTEEDLDYAKSLECINDKTSLRTLTSK